MPVSRNRKSKKSKKKPSQSRKPGHKSQLKSDQHPDEVIIFHDYGRPKISALLLDYGHEGLEFCDSYDKYYKFISFIVMCWNISLFPASERENQIKAFAQDLKSPEIEDQIRYYVMKKLNLYHQYNYFVVNFDLQETPMNFLFTATAVNHTAK